MNVLDQKKEMCLSFDTPPSLFYEHFVSNQEPDINAVPAA